MKNTQCVAACVAAFVFATSASAALQGRNLDGNLGNGYEAYFDTVLNITWLADANLAATNSFGISGYLPDGTMGWDKAQEWVSAMNASAYLGYQDWRLPKVTSVVGASFPLYINSPGYNFFNGSGDLGYNISAPSSQYPGTTASEMAYMFYVNLGNAAYVSPTGQYQPTGGLTNTGPFTNLKADLYWAETAYPGNSAAALYFSMSRGLQNADFKYSNYLAWAVRPGDVAAVPEPETYLFMFVGLAIVGLTAQRKALIGKHSPRR